MRNGGIAAGAGLLILALAACAPKPEGMGAAAQAAQAASASAPPTPALVPPPAPLSTAAVAGVAPPRNQVAPMCKTDGCCAGHGDVALVQRDFAIICTDGQASDICDCHT